MIKIAICDDEEYYRNFLKKQISAYMRKRLLCFTIEIFNDGKAFIDLGVAILEYDIVFLDIDMKEMDGIKTGKKIREFSRSINIVFVTAFISYSLEGYTVNAIRYILKNSNNFSGILTECMDTILEKMNHKSETVKYWFIEGGKEIDVEKILYVESRLHKLTFYVTGSEILTYSLYKKMDEIEQDLEHYGFVRVHQSYLVNMKYVRAVKHYTVTLDNGMDILVSRSKYKVVKNKFTENRGSW